MPGPMYRSMTNRYLISVDGDRFFVRPTVAQALSAFDDIAVLEPGAGGGLIVETALSHSALRDRIGAGYRIEAIVRTPAPLPA